MVESLAAAVICMSLTIYHEARGEPEKGQIAVAHVVMNRVKARNKPVCKVVAEYRQFSWATGKFRVLPHGVYLRGDAFPQDQMAWARARRVALAVIKGWTGDPTNGAQFYHERSVKPVWRKQLSRSGSIGRHVFYRRAV